MNEREVQFLKMVHDEQFRPILLERLERLGLLSAFLLAENETTPTDEYPYPANRRQPCEQ